MIYKYSDSNSKYREFEAFEDFIHYSWHAKFVLTNNSNNWIVLLSLILLEFFDN
jgi:hypothetical protein